MVALHVKFGVALLTSSSCVLSSYYHPSLSFSPDLTFSSSVPPLNFPDCRRVPLSNSGARKSRYTTESFVARAVPCLPYSVAAWSGRVESGCPRQGGCTLHTAPRRKNKRTRERESPSVLTTPPVMCWARHFHDWTWLTYNWIKRNRIPFHVGVYVIDIAVFEGIRSTLQLEIQISSQQAQDQVKQLGVEGWIQDNQRDKK